MKILSVDDNADNRYLLEILLTAYGHDVVSAANGVEALNTLRQHPVDLIISDILMPKMDGYRLCRACKEDAALRNIPFIFITASYTEEKDEGFALGLGADAFIRRPIEPDALMKIIDTALTKDRSAPRPEVVKEETGFLADYAERVVNKLEEKVVALETEIAARKTAEEALRRERALVGRIAETSPVGILLVNRKGRITFANANAEKILGLPREEIVRRTHDAPDWHITDLAGNPVPQADLPVSRVMSGGQPVYDVQHAFAWHNGRRQIVLSISASPLLDQAGEIEGVVVSLEDITERKRLEQELERQARTDVLTGAASRRHFFTRAEEAIRLARRYSHPLSLLMLDLDHFKRVNDTHGHQVGDLVLKALVQLAWQTLRKVDVLGRIGGEEFAILMPETDAEQAFQVAERLRQAVDAAKVPFNGGSVRFTVSIGVATLTDGDTSIGVLLSRADGALYEAKRTGRNRVVVA
jgi:diguanylate cyclase (GGDEF)-like protein/PAS domain S-box-containing protein